MNLHKGWTNIRIERTATWILVAMMERIDKRFLFPAFVDTLIRSEVIEMVKAARNEMMRQYRRGKKGS